MRRFWLILIPALILLACVCPATGGITGTIEAMQGTIAVALTEGPAILTDIPASMSAIAEIPAAGEPGIIRGHLSYPSEFLPAQRVIAFGVATMDAVADVTTEDGQGEYELSVPAGDYYIVAYTLDGGASAGYSQMVPCGLSASCTDHSLIVVHVGPGEVVEDINPQDWYAPEGSFPAMP
ncbi:MAG: hypothetical protein JW748_05875 [Anaerolineales bacterium]|nr:hypothetical protein [Anaerolineales bacterium]